MLQHLSPEVAARELVLLYGSPGSGKTRLATSLPERWGKTAYIALDEGSESLASVLPQYRPRIEVFKPTWQNILVEMAEIYLTDWKSKGFNTLIVDTLSRLAFGTLDEVVEKGLFQEKRVMVGKPGEPGGIALPDRQHYGGTHTIMRNFIKNLILKQPSMNIIAICHQALDDKDDKGHTIGGPALAGRAMIEWVPARFSTVIRLDRTEKVSLVGGKPSTEVRLIARMAPHGAWIARRNEASTTGNSMPMMELDIDPITFWNRYDETRPGKDVSNG